MGLIQLHPAACTRHLGLSRSLTRCLRCLGPSTSPEAGRVRTGPPFTYAGRTVFPYGGGAAETRQDADLRLAPRWQDAGFRPLAPRGRGSRLVHLAALPTLVQRNSGRRRSAGLCAGVSPPPAPYEEEWCGL
jgi:hypothetical protein